MEDVFGLNQVNCVDIEILSYEESKTGFYRICDLLAHTYSVDPEHTKKCLAGDCKTLLVGVTPGWAYDFEAWAQKALPGVILHFIGRIETDLSKISNPFDQIQRQVLESKQDECAELLRSATRASAERDQLKSDNEVLLARINQDAIFIARLQRDSFRLMRALDGKFNKVRIDPNDPDHYIVRPSALTEMRLNGQLSNDVISVTFQLLKPKTLSILDKKHTDKVAQGLGYAGYRPPQAKFMDVNGEFMKRIRKACKPNTRGSLNGTARTLDLLRQYAGVFHEFETAAKRIHNRNIGRHLVNSKFNW
jgi:hypothetical protein